jgi:hypothetical protein
VGINRLELQGSYYDQKLQKEVEYKLTSPFLGGA